MHELSVCQGLMREVERVAIAHRATAGSEVVVAVGPLAGVEAVLLARAFSVALAGTRAAAARLKIETPPITVRCKDCGAETAAKANALLCGGCGAWRVDLLSGDELTLTRVELVVDDEVASVS